MNDIKTLHERLDDEKDFISKVKLAAFEGELIVWEDRTNPPNLSLQDFKVFLARLRNPLEYEFVDRKSERGTHGKLGEDKCFQFEKNLSFFGVLKTYYVKGFFFNKDDLKGVEIQSFRIK